MSKSIKVESKPLKGTPCEIFEKIGHFLFKNVEFEALKSAEWTEIDSKYSPTIGRLLTLQDGGKVEEEMLHYCKSSACYKYAIISSPLPVTNYVATYQVDKIDDKTCKLVWSAVFDSDDENAGDFIANSIFGPVVKGIEKKHGA